VRQAGPRRRQRMPASGLPFWQNGRSGCDYAPGTQRISTPGLIPFGRTAIRLRPGPRTQRIPLPLPDLVFFGADGRSGTAVPGATPPQPYIYQCVTHIRRVACLMPPQRMPTENADRSTLGLALSASHRRGEGKEQRCEPPRPALSAAEGTPSSPRNGR